MMKTIQVTINPDGVSAKECCLHKYDECKHIIGGEKILRTFEIEREECTCGDDSEEVFYCRTICTLSHLNPGEKFTAELLETYREPREGKHGRVKILQ